LEEQIAIGRSDRDPRELLGEAERQLFFRSAWSLELSIRRFTK
jgi:hypothetical protein